MEVPIVMTTGAGSFLWERLMLSTKLSESLKKNKKKTTIALTERRLDKQQQGEVTAEVGKKHQCTR